LIYSNLGRAVGSMLMVVTLSGCGTPTSTTTGTPTSTTTGTTTGSITFEPPTLSCSSPTDLTMTDRLPASTKVVIDPSSNGSLTQDKLSETIDDVGGGYSGTISVYQAPDGAWVHTQSESGQEWCATGKLQPGTHTVALLDPTGTTVAKGTFTVTP
jgi:hypothetical protein